MIENMIARNLVNKRTSEIIFRDISAGIKVEDSYFTLQNLER